MKLAAIKFTETLLIILTLSLAPDSAYAHHPIQSQYNIEQEYTIEGILKRVEIGSPHSFLHVFVVDENGDEGVIRIEWGSASSLSRYYAIDRNSIQIEQRIRVRGYLSKNREDFMIWPMYIHTEFDLEYDRRLCNSIQRSGNLCRVLTDSPPLWPVFSDDN